MDLELGGKRAFVTGATAGIGRAAAYLFAREGVELVLHGRREAVLLGIADEIEASGSTRPQIVVGDLDDAQRCADIAHEAISKSGDRIDILFNNAGASSPLEDVWDEAAWDQSHQLNFASTRQMTAVIAPSMKQNSWGRIVNVTGAMVAPSPNAAAPAKAALQSWSRSLSMQLAPFGITVNTIAPGRILTDQIKNRLHPTQQSQQEFIDRFIPAGYFGEPEDLAVLAVFLASPLARYINGAAIPVDGAMHRIG